MSSTTRSRFGCLGSCIRVGLAKSENKKRNPLKQSGFLWYWEKQSVAKNYKNKAGHTGVEINSRISEISTQ